MIFGKKPEHVPILEFIQKRAVRLVAGLAEMASYYDDLLEKYHVTLICDNPAFDIGAVDYNWLIFDIRRYGMKNGKDGVQYISCYDPSGDSLPYDIWKKWDAEVDAISESYLRGCSDEEKAHLGGKHYPVYDALKNYFMFIHSQAQLKKLLPIDS